MEKLLDAANAATPQSSVNHYRSEVTSRDLYFRVSATDLLMCTDLLPGFDLITYQYQKVYRQGGDKIFCDTIDGGASWGIRLGASQNPIIRLRPGRTINKPFRYFTLYSTEPAPGYSSPGGNGDLQETQIELYISTGEPLIIDAPREQGKGFGSRSTGRTDCIASTTPRLILADFNNPGFPNNENITQWKPGRHGATLLLRNTQVNGNNPLFIAQQSSSVLVPVLKQEMWRLFPGEPLVIDLDGSIQQAFNSVKIIGTPDVGFVVYTRAGTVLYDWMISRLDCDPAPTRPQDNVGFQLG